MTCWHKLGNAAPRAPFAGALPPREREKESKGAWWMPRLTEAMKDVVSCEKLREGANGL